MERSLEQKFSDTYIANLDIITEGFPESVNSPRRGFLENFNILCLPDTKEERYRHTDLSKIFGGEREQYFMPVLNMRIGQRLPIDGYNIDIINGFVSEDSFFTRLDNGIAYGSIKTATSTLGHVIEKYYNSIADNDKESVTALNSMFMQDGAFVYVPKGEKAEKPFVLNFEYLSAEEPQICFSRALIIIEEGAEADVVISHHNGDDVGFSVNFVRETILGEDATLNLSEIIQLHDKSSMVSGNYLTQAAGSRTNMMNVWLRGGAIRVNAITDLAGRGADSNLYGLWFGTDDECTDINMRINHLVADCTSFELVKGVVSGEATGAFTGMVYVAKQAQRTIALQQSRNLQMSDTSRIYTEPQLEIYADDVKCSHGATVGQLDTDALFYMRQRGISEGNARKLQMFGFVNDVISRCPHTGACDFIAKLAEERIEDL